MRRTLTGLLLLTLSIGIALNLTASFQTICSITFEECGAAAGHDACCATGCCHEAGEQDCCLVLPENDSEFVTPPSIPPIESPFLADVSFEFDSFFLPVASEVSFTTDHAPDPPPRSGRVLLALIERCLI